MFKSTRHNNYHHWARTPQVVNIAGHLQESWSESIQTAFYLSVSAFLWISGNALNLSQKINLQSIWGFLVNPSNEDTVQLNFRAQDRSLDQWRTGTGNLLNSSDRSIPGFTSQPCRVAVVRASQYLLCCLKRLYLLVNRGIGSLWREACKLHESRRNPQ